MITLTIDGRKVSVPEGTLVVEAARRAGVHVPVYCYHPKLDPVGACRICLVQIERIPKIVTACTTVASEGMVVHTLTDPVKEARRGVLEFLLINHPLDCPICDKGGECDLQDFTLAYGPPTSRFLDDKILRRKAVDLPPFLVLDEERCILCQRCVRYEDEILGERNLVLIDRGGHTTIGPEGHEGYPGSFSGNNTELCPVGALTGRPYRFRARPWDLTRTPTICTQCALHCNVTADVRHGNLLRLMSRENDAIDGGWLCDRGRYGYGDATAPDRLQHPLLRRGGDLVPVSWDAALAEVGRALAAGPVAGLGGGRLSNEEAAAFRRVCGTVDWRVGFQRHAVVPGAAEAAPADLDAADVIVLADTCPAEEAPVLDLRVRRAARDRARRVVDVGPVPNLRVGRCERVTCLPEELAGALGAIDLRDAKHPVVVWNGRGGEDVVAAIAGLGAPVLMVHEVANARGAHDAGCEADGDILAAAAAGGVHTLWLAGANPLRSWPDPELARRALERVSVRIVSELYPTETMEMADIVLPVAGPYEKAGSYTNLAGMTQRTAAVVRAPGEARPDLRIFQHLEAARQPATDLPPWLVRPLAERPAGALRRLLRPRLWSGGGAMRFDPALEAARTDLPVIVVHPDTGLDSGGRVEADGLSATVALHPDVHPDVAVLPERWPGAAGPGEWITLAVNEARVG